jgi:predicted lipid-binding transport protein (Tim44 family)
MMQDDDLDQLFAEAATQRIAPSDALMTRIQADADAWQPKPRPVVAPAPSRGWLSAVADWFGGGMSLAGMSAAALAGLFLGIAQPVPVVALTELLRGTTTLDSLDLLPTGGALWTLE